MNLQQRPSVRVFVAGDSTAASYAQEREPLSGWGQAIGRFFQPLVEVRNRAVSGSSSKSFLEKGHWHSLVQELQAGDYVLIQFGHNDAKDDPNRHTDPGSSFPSYLRGYVEDAGSKGAYPVLLTPVERREVTADGGHAPTHGPYAEAVRQLAHDSRVPLLELSQASLDLYREWGAARSRELFLWLEPGAYPAYPEGKQDDTHFCRLGAETVAGLIAGLIRNSPMELRRYLA